MARVCQVTGKKPQVGHHVSHANNKTIRRFYPNLQYRRFWVESEKRWVRLRISNAGVRIIDKKGIEAVHKELRERGEISPEGAVTMREKIKLESTAGTVHFYTTAKNKLTTPDNTEIKKLSPRARK